MESPRVVVPFAPGPALLRFRGGARNTWISLLDEPGYREPAALAAVSFRGAPGRVEQRGSDVLVDMSIGFWDALFGPPSSTTIALSPHVPWRIDLRGGLDGLELDLAGLRLSGLDLRGGVSRSDLRLPAPVGTARVAITGGVSELSIARPGGVPIAFELCGGASGLALDGLELGSVASLAWKSEGFDDANDRWVVAVRGGASHATIGFGERGAATPYRSLAPAFLGTGAGVRGCP